VSAPPIMPVASAPSRSSTDGNRVRATTFVRPPRSSNVIVSMAARSSKPATSGPGHGLRKEPYADPMRMSTIAKQREAGPGTRFARVLGKEVRKRRIALGRSQASVGRPLTRAFLSSLQAAGHPIVAKLAYRCPAVEYLSGCYSRSGRRAIGG
jgi:hypothetical protein